jgi:hypothetical protein
VNLYQREREKVQGHAEPRIQGQRQQVRPEKFLERNSVRGSIGS